MNNRLEELENRMVTLEHELNSTREQLTCLRRGNRVRFLAPTVGLIAFMAISGAVAFAGKRAAPEPLTVKAPFTVVDDAGKTVASVLNDADLRGIQYFDALGHEAGRASCNRDGSSIIVAESGNGSQRSGLLAAANGLASVRVFQKDQLCAALGNDDKGTALALFDEKGVPLFRASHPAGTPPRQRFAYRWTSKLLR